MDAKEKKEKKKTIINRIIRHLRKIYKKVNDLVIKRFAFFFSPSFNITFIEEIRITGNCTAISRFAFNYGM